MEILNNNKISQQNIVSEPLKATPVTFKGIVPVMNSVGSFMQGIENGGFVLSFLIQDFLGMTVPRTGAGFLRDKDVTGEYNFQEGFEVLGREGLTGPCMMAVAPVSLFILAKCGKSTSVNSQLIKRFGNSLKEIVANNNFDRSILNNKDKFKEEFYKKNIKSILEQTLGKEHTNNTSVEYIYKQLQNYDNIPPNAQLKKFRGKSRYRANCLQNIAEHIDKIRYSTSSELNNLQKVKFGAEKLNDSKLFDTKKTFDALSKYANDAITVNKHLDKLNEAAAEKIKNISLGKRVVANIVMIASTLGILSILPKIYARADVAPGARKNYENKNETNNLTFKGKNKSSINILEKIGKLFAKNKSDFVSQELEYNGMNFTNTLMAGLSIFGLLTPRGLRAYNRAQTDENGKKDLTELWEILCRDITSSLAVVFAVPMLTRAAISSYENKSGFVLMQKNRNMSKMKNFLEIINPYSSIHVLTNSEITSLYNNVDTKDKMLNFCKYINENGGDLEKILSKSKNADKIFNENSINLNEIKNLPKAEKNKKIISFIENLEKYTDKLSKHTNNKNANEIIKELMKGTNPGKSNITKFAKGLNSIPAAIATVFISPYILGWVIPRFTYKNTRRIHEKEDQERAKLKTSA